MRRPAARHRKSSTTLPLTSFGVGALLTLPVLAQAAHATPSDDAHVLVADSPKDTTDTPAARLVLAAAAPVDIVDPAAVTAAAPATNGPAAVTDVRTLPAGPLGIPGPAYDAYKRAETLTNETTPGCHMNWLLLAGIGQVESGHAGGRFTATGDVEKPVIGPRLDGSLPGSMVVADTDGGALDGDAAFDRAVGPVQFLPETWKMLGRDGNGDGIADPQNIYDSTASTAALLCSGGRDMNNPADVAKAILAYNQSQAYVTQVLAWARGFETDKAPDPSSLPRVH